MCGVRRFHPLWSPDRSSPQPGEPPAGRLDRLPPTSGWATLNPLAAAAAWSPRLLPPLPANPTTSDGVALSCLVDVVGCRLLQTVLWDMQGPSSTVPIVWTGYRLYSHEGCRPSPRLLAERRTASDGVALSLWGLGASRCRLLQTVGQHVARAPSIALHGNRLYRL